MLQKNLEIRKKVVATVLHISNMKDIDPDQITDDTPLFHGGLGLDSVDALELIVAIEKQYGIKIRNDEGGHKTLKNIGNLVKEISDHYEQKIQ